MIRYLKEEEYEAGMRDTVIPYLTARRTDGSFVSGKAKDGCDVCIHYVKYKADEARGSVTILHGYTESTEKYHELAYYFLLSGLDVFLIDHRGHGYSHRDVTDLTLTHIDGFDDYVNDFAAFMKEVVANETDAPRYIYAHSMGGAVAALYLERADAICDKAILNSPMIAPCTGGFPAWATALICRTAILFGKSKKRVFVCAPYPGHENFACSCSTCEKRFEEYQEQKRTVPNLQNYSPTYRWMLESLNVTKKILKKGAPERINCPVTLFQSELEDTVKTAPQEEFILRVPKGKFEFVAGAKHESYSSPDVILHPYLDKVLGFFAEN